MIGLISEPKDEAFLWVNKCMGPFTAGVDGLKCHGWLGGYSSARDAMGGSLWYDRFTIKTQHQLFSFPKHPE